jgi:hypothetical protein
MIKCATVKPISNSTIVENKHDRLDTSATGSSCKLSFAWPQAPTDKGRIGRSQHHFPIVGEATKNMLVSQQPGYEYRKWGHIGSGRMDGAIKGVERIYEVQPAIGRWGIADTQLCMVGQPKDPSTLFH